MQTIGDEDESNIVFKWQSKRLWKYVDPRTIYQLNITDLIRKWLSVFLQEWLPLSWPQWRMLR